MASLELTAFIADHSQKGWQPGHVDCLLTLADWFVWRGFPDAVAEYRGTYDSEDGYRQLLVMAGGPIPLISKQADAIGLVRVEQQRAGSIGVIGSKSNIQRQFGAIYDGAHWMLRADEGFLPMTARAIAVWDMN